MDREPIEDRKKKQKINKKNAKLEEKKKNFKLW